MDQDIQQRARSHCELIADVARISRVRLKATGASMLPTIWPGDVLVTEPQSKSGPQPGTIVLCLRDGGLMAHRVVRREVRHLTTRGDSHLHNDPPVLMSDVLGEVVSICRGGRTFNPAQSGFQRVVSAILRRSDICTRMMLRLGRVQRYFSKGKISWAS